MHLKRFRGETVRDALAAAKAALGEDALVLSTQMVAAHGLRGLMGAREIEITAAVERPLSENRQARPALRRSAPDDALAARLAAAGFPAPVAADVAGRARRRDRRSLSGAAIRGAVAEWLSPMVAADDRLAGTEIFIGPPGAGKTTTIAKLAAQARVRTGASPCLVSTDVHRVGATEALRQYADILGSPFVTAASAGELGALAPSGTPILIDTAGGSLADEGLVRMMDGLRSRGPVRAHLVIPAATSVRDIARLLPRDAAARPDRIVLTKVDEAESAAALAGALRESGLPVSWLGMGQRVPEDLCRATPARLAAALLGELTTEHAA